MFYTWYLILAFERESSRSSIFWSRFWITRRLSSIPFLSLRTSINIRFKTILSSVVGSIILTNNNQNKENYLSKILVFDIQHSSRKYHYYYCFIGDSTCFIGDPNMLHWRPIWDLHAWSETNLLGRRPAYMPN